MAGLSKEDIRKLVESKSRMDEEALEILVQQLEKYVKDAEALASEAAKLDGRNRIEKKDIQDVLRFRDFFHRSRN